MFDASIIICTHNPRAEYIQRVLDALSQQSLPKDKWELLLIDNASDPAVALSQDISWHLNGRQIKEDEIGLVQARLRGIQEARGGLLVFVDDDLVLAPNYLATALAILAEFPQIGAFGCSLTGRFEIPAPEPLRSFLHGLCVDELDRDHWSNEYIWSRSVPYGTGLCVRSDVAQHYMRELERTPWRRGLDRIGAGMGAGGDTDLAFTAIDVGYGVGRFVKLKAEHLISSQRLTENYIARLHAGFAYSNVMLERGRKLDFGVPRSRWRALVNHWISLFVLRGMRRRVHIESRKAIEAAWRIPEADFGRD